MEAEQNANKRADGLWVRAVKVLRFAFYLKDWHEELKPLSPEQKKRPVATDIYLKAAAILGGLFVVSLGAATQVWDYPKPRTDFGIVAVWSAFLAMGFWFLSMRFEQLEYTRRNGKRAILKGELKVLIITSLALAVLTLIAFNLAVFWYRPGLCLLVDVPVCTMRAS